MATELDPRETEFEAVAYDEQLRDLNETSRELASSTSEAINVDLYPVVTWFASLLTLLSVGLLGNATLLLATVTSRRYGNRARGPGSKCHVTSRHSTSLLINQSIVGLIVCLLVAPLEFATVAENYLKRPLPSAVCWAGAAGYQLAVGTLVTCFVLRSVTQCRHLRSCLLVERRSKGSATRSSACTGRSGGGSGARRQLSDRSGCRSKITWRRWMLIDAILPWLSGVIAAALTSVELFYVLDYRVCLNSVAYREIVADLSGFRSSSGDGNAWRWRAVLAVIYLSALISSGVALVTNYFLGRKKLASILVQSGADELSRRLLDDPACVGGDHEIIESTARQTNTAPENGGKNRRSASGKSQRGKDSSKAKSTGSRSSGKQSSSRKEIADDDASPSLDAAADEETADPDVEDDDTFDLKMRLKFQKKSRSSGRRHTVANIGLPDLVGRLRRGSLSDTRLTAGVAGGGSSSGRRQQGPRGAGGDGGSVATTPEYHYARKWSVDLIALADQLENPKAALLMAGAGRTGSCQFNELPGSLRASPSPPRGGGGSGLPTGCTRAIGVRTGRSSSPVAARPTLPRIVAENENVEPESTSSPPDGGGVAHCVDIRPGEMVTAESQKDAVIKTASAAETPAIDEKSAATANVIAATCGDDNGSSETPLDKNETTSVEKMEKNVTDVEESMTAAEVDSETPSAEKPVDGSSSMRRCSTSSPRRHQPMVDCTNEHFHYQPSPVAAARFVSSDRLDNISTLLPLDPPSIVVSSLNEDDRRSLTVNSDDDYGSNTTPTDGSWNAHRGQRLDDQHSGQGRTSCSQSADGGTSPNRTLAIDDRSISRIRRQLERTRRLCIMLAISASLAAPYAFVLVWNSDLMAMISESSHRRVSYNMTLVAGAVMGVLFAIHGPLTVWVDRGLLARLVAMWTELSRLRCVCYCNIGRGRNCFHRSTIADGRGAA